MDQGSYQGLSKPSVERMCCSSIPGGGGAVKKLSTVHGGLESFKARNVDERWDHLLL